MNNIKKVLSAWMLLPVYYLVAAPASCNSGLGKQEEQRKTSELNEIMDAAWESRADSVRRSKERSSL